MKEFLVLENSGTIIGIVQSSVFEGVNRYTNHHA